MVDIIITDPHLVIKLYKIGFFNYFPSNELRISITRICLDSYKNLGYANQTLINNLNKKGNFQILDLNENEMTRAMILYKNFNRAFILKTISAFVVAEKSNLILIADDEVEIEKASELGIFVANKYWLLKKLIDEIAIMGIEIEFDVVKDII